MKMSIKVAAFAIAAASIVTPFYALADDGTPEGGGQNCSNIRTITNSRCVHYNEKARDGWANQQANKGTDGMTPRPIDTRNPYAPPPKPIDTNNPYTPPPRPIDTNDPYTTPARPIDGNNPYVATRSGGGAMSLIQTKRGGGGSGSTASRAAR